MTKFSRLIHAARQARARQLQREHLTDILRGPNTTYRSELIEAISNIR